MQLRSSWRKPQTAKDSSPSEKVEEVADDFAQLEASTNQTAVEIPPLLPSTTARPPCPPHGSVAGAESLTMISRGIATVDSLPNYLGALPDTLTALNLHSNQLSSLSGLGLLAQLVDLNLSSNTIEVMDASELAPLRHLRSLNLASNKLRRVGGLGGLVSLEVLNLSHNKIFSLGGLCQMTPSHRLRLLDLRDNRIVNLSEITGPNDVDANLPSLRSIMLRSNDAHVITRADGNTVCCQRGYVAAICQLAPNVKMIDAVTRREAEDAEHKMELSQIPEPIGEAEDVTRHNNEQELTDGVYKPRKGESLDNLRSLTETTQFEAELAREQATRKNVNKPQDHTERVKHSGNPWSYGGRKDKDLNPKKSRGSRLDQLATPAIDRARRRRMMRNLKTSQKYGRESNARNSRLQHNNEDNCSEDIVTVSARRRQNVTTMLTEQAKQISSLLTALKESRKSEARLRLRLRAAKPKAVEAAAKEAQMLLHKAQAEAQEARSLLAKREEEILDAQIRAEEGARSQAAGEAAARMAENELKELRATFQAEKDAWTSERNALKSEMARTVQAIKDGAEKMVRQAQSEVKTAEEQMTYSRKLAESERARASAGESALEDARNRNKRLEEARDTMQQELRLALQTGAVAKEKLDSTKALHDKELVRLKAEREHAKTLTRQAAEELRAAARDSERLRAVLKNKDGELDQAERRTREFEVEQASYREKMKQMQEALAQATIAAKRGADARVEEAEGKEKAALARVESLEAELDARMKQVDAMEKRAGDSALNFEKVKAAYEDVCGERAQLRNALESASDVVRRQKDLVRRQASELVSTKRDASAMKAEAEAAMREQAKVAQEEAEALRKEIDSANSRVREAHEKAETTLKDAQKELREAQERTRSELQAEHAVAIKRAVELAAEEVEDRIKRENAELKRLLAQSREKMAEGKALREKLESSEKIKAALIDDKNESIAFLKEELETVKKSFAKADGWRAQRDRLKVDLRYAEDREAEVRQKLLKAEDQLRDTNESFDSIREHLEAIIDEQVSSMMILWLPCHEPFSYNLSSSSLLQFMNTNCYPASLSFYVPLHFRLKNYSSLHAVNWTKVAVCKSNLRRKMP